MTVGQNKERIAAVADALRPHLPREWTDWEVRALAEVAVLAELNYERGRVGLGQLRGLRIPKPPPEPPRAA